MADPYVPEDLRRWQNDSHRQEMLRRARAKDEPLSNPQKPYTKRDIDGWDTRGHCDEYPWVGRRWDPSFERGVWHRGSHCFSIELPPGSLGTDDAELLKCEHCGAISVSDIDDVQWQPCPNEPTAILLWFQWIMSIVTQLPHERCRASVRPYHVAPSEEAWIANDLCRAPREAGCTEVRCATRPRVSVLWGGSRVCRVRDLLPGRC